MSDWVPFRLEPLLVEKPWGGQRLRRLGRVFPDSARVGESWDLADLDASMTDVPEASSRISSGPLDGLRLRDAVRLGAADLLGVPLAGLDRFPLLVKHLDAREHLSVQVHPTAEVVGEMPGTHLKTESWVVVDADPGSELMIGLAPHATLAAVERSLGTAALVGMLRRVPARVGDVHHVPPGVVHALGAGIVVAEVQTPSDTTFRLYDWTVEYGRAPRDLHVEVALASMRAAWAANLAPPEPVRGEGLVVDTDAYRIERRHAEADRGIAVPARRTARVLLVLAGRLAVPALERPLERSEVAVLPAVWAGEMRAGAGSTWLEIDLVPTGP
jgi:mannose-6-phosphate isomerase